MIQSYGDDTTRDIHFGDNTKSARTIPQSIWPVARRKLNMIDYAKSLADLRSPGNNLEKLRGDWDGFYSIHINNQWRIVFKFWDSGSADEVQIVDYH
ncbi:MAG TPA: type II toxin-antitoxin system RelE/ParE family toxin [Polyangiaceae bacterium]|nr:type II toxin-antitoxin system RelE/ParE family toxin [Polyangiaceae bacterium]